MNLSRRLVACTTAALFTANQRFASYPAPLGNAHVAPVDAVAASDGQPQQKQWKDVMGLKSGASQQVRFAERAIHLRIGSRIEGQPHEPEKRMCSTS